MIVPFLDLKKNYEDISSEINNEFQNLFNKCDFIHGEKVKIFENNFANYLGINHFIGCANGTDALEIAVKSLDLKENDEIIVQGNTYIATCLGVLNNNIKLVLCDIDQDSHMINIENLKKKINTNTKALIIVHLYGLVPDMDLIKDICDENNLYLIEDCAQAHGALWKDKKCGAFGDISCFSFYPGKNLGAYGDGGGIGTNNSILNEKIRKILNLGCKVKYYHELLGRNSRLDTIQASFLNVKLKYLDNWNESRRKNAKLYIKKLSDNKYIKLPFCDNNCTPVYHLFVIRTEFRDELQKYLEENNITSLIHYPISVGETEALQKFKFTDIDNCIKNSNEILSLPMYPELSEEAIDYVCENINNFFLKKNLLNLIPIETKNKIGVLNCINQINFSTKRIFYIDGFSMVSEFNKEYFDNQNINSKRGLHANINFDELLIIIDGEILMNMTDKDSKKITKNLKKNDIFYVPRMNWIEFEILNEKTIIFVLANENIENSKSIHNFNEFINF